MFKLVNSPMAALWVLFGMAGSTIVQAGETRTQKEPTISRAAAPAPGGATVLAHAPGKPSDFMMALPGRRVARGAPKGPVRPDGANVLKPADKLTTSSAAVLPPPPITNLVITTAPWDQIQPIGVQNGGGGYFIAWTDYRSGTTYDIYAQLVSAAGTAMWAPGGVPVCKGAGFQTNPRLVADGLGGAIVAWQDDRSGNLDIYAQRLSSSGTPQWAPNGVAICSAAGQQRLAGIVGDGADGAIAVWEDDRAGGSDIYVQRVTDLGVTLWPADGVALCTAAGPQQVPVIVTDQLSGAIVAWQDFRGGATSDIYAQRVNASGTPLWTPADGVALCTAANTQEFPSIAVDGAGGAVVGAEVGCSVGGACVAGSASPAVSAWQGAGTRRPTSTKAAWGSAICSCFGSEAASRGRGPLRSMPQASGSRRRSVSWIRPVRFASNSNSTTSSRTPPARSATKSRKPASDRKRTTTN